MNFMGGKNFIHIEVCIKHNECHPDSMKTVLQPQLKQYIAEMRPSFNMQRKICQEALTNDRYSCLGAVESFLLECDNKRSEEFVRVEDLEKAVFHYYSPHRREMEFEMFENETDVGSAGDGGQVPSSNHWLMPSKDFICLWENLIYEKSLKEKLLRFALSALTFSQHQVNQNIISCNRLILLHGPPGTGKTSLCKALAQKLSIRISHVFPHTHLIEINSHSLFSKWFSESGKLVMRLFAKIRDLIECRKNLVCVLIDEVESLAYARNSMAGQEPKDAMRVVNALLTQLDSIKEEPNVLILATSNLAECIDLAFLDRADIKQYIGLPSCAAIRRIYETMLLEVMRAGIVRHESLQEDDKHEGLLDALSERSIGLSGRTLRKLPFLAMAEHTVNEHLNKDEKIWLSDFLDAMMIALEKHQKDHKQMTAKKKAPSL